MLRFSRNSVILTAVFFVSGWAIAQQAKPVPETQTTDAKIAQAVKEVSAEKIQERQTVVGAQADWNFADPAAVLCRAHSN